LSQSIYGTGDKAGFDTYGNRLPDYPTVKAGISLGNSDLYCGKIDKSKLTEEIRNIAHQTGFKTYVVNVTHENQGLKSFGFIVDKVGYVSVDIKYNQQEEFISASND
jgi:hypothetical protein